MLTPRRKCKTVNIAQITIGPDSPVIVQGMTKVPTRDIEPCLEQISAMTRAGCELVRVAAATPEDTLAIKQLVDRSPVPLIADVHFHFARAIEAVEAGVAKIRLNPGNIQDRHQVEQVIAACKSHHAAIRVGVNEGSIRPKKDNDTQSPDTDKKLIDLMVAKMHNYVRIFEDIHFDQLVLSAKCHDAARTIAANRAIAHTFQYPMHLGVTHAGMPETAAIQSAAALGTLLAEGIGDTIRISLAGDPVTEIRIAWEILTTLNLRPRRTPELIVCPTCGRTEIDLLAIARQVENALAHIDQPIKVAVMGCVVNGPGEAKHADIALCGGKDKALIYRQGQKIAAIPADQAIEALLKEIKNLLTPKTP